MFEHHRCPAIIICSRWTLTLKGARRDCETSLMNVGNVPVQQQLCVCVCVRARACVPVMNCLADCAHDLDRRPGEGTDCWVKVQACFYAQLYVTSSIALHRKPSWLALWGEFKCTVPLIRKRVVSIVLIGDFVIWASLRLRYGAVIHCFIVSFPDHTENNAFHLQWSFLQNIVWQFPS
jgi:hypothetical protein